MKMARLDTCLLPVVVALASFHSAGCSFTSSSNAVAPEMTALDQAYRAGVFTKTEYEAKKAGIRSQAPALEALRQAVAAGVVSKNDYPAMKARLIAKGTAIAALEQAHQAGVFSDQEYAARKAALETTGSPPPGVAAVALPASPQPVASAAPSTPSTTSATSVPARIAATPSAAPATRPSRPADNCAGWKDTNNFMHNLGVCDEKNVDETPAQKKDRNVLPSWVPMYPGATSLATDIFQENGRPVYSQNFKSPGPVPFQTVVDFYRTRLTGFKTISSHAFTDSAGIEMENAKYKFSLGVTRFPGEPNPMISVRVEEK
jgi:hypothetical protein